MIFSIVMNLRFKFLFESLFISKAFLDETIRKINYFITFWCIFITFKLEIISVYFIIIFLLCMLAGCEFPACLACLNKRSRCCNSTVFFKFVFGYRFGNFCYCKIFIYNIEIIALDNFIVFVYQSIT